jgi:apolipoprotein N-acyltransferase
VCLVPWLLALRRARPARAAALGATWSVLAAYAVGDAMPGSMAAYFHKPAAVGWLVFLVVALASAVPFYGAFALAYGPLVRRAAPPWRALLVAAAWTAAELGRGRVFTDSTVSVGNPWGLLAYSQVGFETLLQIASVVGVYGVSFALAALNAAVADLVAAACGRVGRRTLAGLAVASGPAALALGFGAVALARAPAFEDVSGHHRVAMVQADLDLGSQWRSEFYGRNLDDYLRLSLQAVDAGPPELLIWPEGSLSFPLEQEPDFQRSLARLTGGAHLELLAGGPGLDGGDPPAYFNSVFLLGPDGTVRGRYDKRHLLPISEFFPVPGVDWLRRRFGRVHSFTHGRRTAPLPTRLGPAGILVCNEGMLPEVAAQRVREGASFLVNPSNDSWLGRERWGVMMFEMIGVRAIEQRRYLVRASTSGPSGIVDPWGRVRVRSEPLSRAVTVGWVAPRSDRTLYARFGDAFAFGCALAALGALAFGRPRRDAAASCSGEG